MDIGNASEHPKENIKDKTSGGIRFFGAILRCLEVKDTRRHAVDEMSGSENGITPKIGRKRSGQHKGTCNFRKVAIFLFNKPILLGCKHKNFGEQFLYKIRTC